MASRLIGKARICRLLGCSPKQLDQYIRKPDFPRMIISSEYRCGWDEDDIQKWILKKLEKKHSNAKKVVEGS